MTSAARSRLGRLLGVVVDEWFGDGMLMRQGAWTEVAVSAATLPMGIGLILRPGAASYERTLNLVSWTYPAWSIGAIVLAASLLSLAGLALYFVQGRCRWSKRLRFAGAAVGLLEWLFLLLAHVGAWGWGGVSVYLYLLVVLLYARASSLALRRFR